VHGLAHNLEPFPHPSCPPPHTQLFGLHANADISYYTAATKALWSGLLDLQPRTGGGPGSAPSREEVVGAVARDIRGRLPEPFDVLLLRKAFGVPSPTQVRDECA
jgi:dynein heavy chain